MSRVYWGERSPSRACWSRVPPFQERREFVCAQSTVKTRSKNIELVTSNGRVTDTSSAETNLASHLTSCAWRLQQGVEASRCSSQSASRAVCPLRQLCRIMVRYAPLVSQRPKPSRVIRRLRPASALSATTSVFRRLQRCCEWCRERRDMCLSVRGTFLSIYTSVPVRLAALPDTLVPRIGPPPHGPISPPL